MTKWASLELAMKGPVSVPAHFHGISHHVDGADNDNNNEMSLNEFNKLNERMI